MAENKQEKRTIQVGDQKYLVDDILGLSAAQLNNYFTFAREKGGYDDEGIASLRNYINKRLDNIKAGQGFNADGSFDGDVVENVTMKVKKPGGFGKKEITQGNRDWANNYFYHLIKNLKPYQETEDKSSENTWDISKHGLNAYLTGQGLDAKHIFENYDLKDTNNPNAARSFTQRRELLKQHLGGYRDWLKSKGFDFTKNDNEWDDNYLTDFESFVNNFDTLDNNALATALRKYGAGNYTTAFTSDKWDLTKTNEEIEAERKAAADKKKKEEMDKAWGDEKARRYGIYTGLSDLRSGQMQQYMGKDKIFDLTDEDIEHHMASKKISGAEAEKAYWDNLDAQYARNPYDISIAQLILPMRARQGVLKSIDSGDYAGWSYDPTTINDSRQSVMAFDPITGKMEEIFIGHLTNDWARIKNQFMQKQGYTDPLAAFAKEGGVLEFQTGGTLSSYDYIQSYKKDKNAERAKETGNSEEVQKARDRVVSNGDDSFTSEQASLASPDAGFTGADKARLASIGADIASIFLDPVTGVTVGLGSTLTNFGADIADDGFQWEDVKNLGINAGFDLLGAIPIFGDAVGTGAKIARTALKWAPRMMTALAAFQGVNNFDGMMNSWSKLTSGDKEQKLTVQDWRNIAQSISLVTGGIRATRNKIAQNEMKNAARVDGVVGVNVYNKQTQQMERVLVDGDVAKNVRAAQGDKAKIEAELSKLDDFKDKFGESGTLEVATGMGGLQKPWEKVTNADGKTSRQLRNIFSDGRAQVTDVYDFSRVNGTRSDIANWLSTKGIPTIENNQKGKMSSEAFEVKQKELLDQAGVEAQVGKVKDAVEARKKYLEKIKGRITDTEGELATVKQQAGGDDFVARQMDAETRLAGLPSKQAINDAQAVVTARQKFIDQANQKRQALSDSRQKQIADMEAGLNARLDTMNKTLNRLKSRKKILSAKQKAGTLGKKEATELKNLASRIKDVQKAIKTTQSEIVTNTSRIKSLHGKKRAQLKADIKTAKGEIATATPIAAQSKDVASAVAQRKAAVSGQELQKRLNTLQGRQASHDPATSHTQAYRDLENMLNNLRTSNPNIGSRTVNWDMNAILQRYGVNASDVFKSGGSININKINKFLKYAKG